MNSKFYKLVVITLVALLIFSTLPLSEANAKKYDDSNDLNQIVDENDLKESLEEELENENVKIEEVDFSSSEDLVIIDAKSDVDESHIDEFGQLQARFEIEPGSDNFSVFVVEEIDEVTYEKEYQIQLSELSDESMTGKAVDVESGEIFNLDSSEGTASLAFVIPAGITMTKAVLSALYTTGAMIIAGGAAYVVATKAKKSKKYNHFKAIRKNGSVYVGGGLSRSKAISRMKSKKDVYSISKNQAKLVAAGANKNGQPIHEVDRKNGKPKKGYYYHWHPYKRTPKAHSFYGNPVK